MDGLKLDTEKNEGKMIAAIVDMLEDVSYAISDIEDNAQAVSDELDEIEASLDVMEEIVFDEDGEEDEDEDFDFGDEALYEVKCPTCGEVITIDESTIEEGSTNCPKCGEELEFDMDDEEDF
ncbi:MAG: zinc ribbon domain-containing protein [Oscillospiraceae bacterium]|nr:zinc ribbon domain-containing protein [Oscillospiraceae bacterium]